MDQKLFREQSVQHATRRLDGDVVVVTPISVFLLGSVLVTALILGLVFAFNASYTRKETVPGWLVPESGAVRATAIRGGVIQELLVDTGADVALGQPIAKLKLSVDTGGGDYGDALILALEGQLIAAQKTYDATSARIDVAESRISNQLRNTRLELSVLQDQITALDEQLEIAERNAVWSAENLSEGLTTRADAEGWRANQLNLERERLALLRQQSQLNRQVADLQQNLESFEPEREAASAEIDSARATLRERLTRAGSEASYTVTSPIAGRVDVLPFETGQTVSPGGSIAVLNPVGSKLIAELYVPSRAAGFVKEGQAIRLKYDAFPFQRFGSAAGQIVEVSRTILGPSEVGMVGIQFQEPVFRVRAEIKDEQIHAYGELIELRSGMLLSADIEIDERSLIEWLFDPIYAASRS